MADLDQVLVEFRSRCVVAVRELGIDSSFGLREHRRSDEEQGPGVRGYGESDDDSDESDAIMCDEGEERPSNTFIGMHLPRPTHVSYLRSDQHSI